MSFICKNKQKKNNKYDNENNMIIQIFEEMNKNIHTLSVYINRGSTVIS